MADRQVSNDDQTLPSATGGSGAGASGDSTQDAATELAEAQRRLRGQERAHQKDMGKLQSQLDDMKSMLTNALQNRQSGDDTVAVSADILNSLDPNDPKDRLLRELYQNQAQWSQAQRKSILDQQAAQRQQLAVEEAVEEVIESGVPRSALNLSSPESVRASAKEWLAEDRIKKLEDEVKEYRAGRVNADDQARLAVTRERQRLGATTVSTSTGEAVPLPTAVQQELERLDEALQTAKKTHKGAEVIRLNREKALLLEEANAR